jgi:hypothetical protein
MKPTAEAAGTFDVLDAEFISNTVNMTHERPITQSVVHVHYAWDYQFIYLSLVV